MLFPTVAPVRADGLAVRSPIPGPALERWSCAEVAEGGGAFAVDGQGIAHFLVADAVRARFALEAAGITVLAAREVLVQRLDQETPGQLGKLCRRMADAGVNIEVLYSDHANQLVLVVDDLGRGRSVSEAWGREGPG